MKDLIKKLEAASSGSRELDAHVEAAALTGHCWIKLPNDEHRLRKGQVLVKGFPEELTAFADAEPVTTSIDAAIALVHRLTDSADELKSIYLSALNAWFADDVLDHRKFARHLCIALLRALQAKEAGQ